MKMISFKPICVGLALFPLWVIGGCGTSPDPRLYVLKQTSSTALQPGLESNVSVLVRPVVLPDYLKRSEIIFKSGDSRITVNEYDKWAGSLEDNVTSVIRANLAAYLGSDETFDYHANFTAKPEVTVRVRINTFGPINDATSELDASWEIGQLGTGQTRLFSEKFSTQIQKTNVAGSDLTPETRAMSEALDQLSRKIAEQIARPERASRS